MHKLLLFKLYHENEKYTFGIYWYNIGNKDVQAYFDAFEKHIRINSKMQDAVIVSASFHNVIPYEHFRFTNDFIEDGNIFSRKSIVKCGLETFMLEGFWDIVDETN